MYVAIVIIKINISAFGPPEIPSPRDAALKSALNVRETRFFREIPREKARQRHVYAYTECR